MTQTMIDEKTDFVSRFINQTTTPAFYDGYQIITLGMKYDVGQRSDGRYFVSESQMLVRAGFERNLGTWCAPSMQGNMLESSWEFPSDFLFNASAEAYRLQWSEARKAEILATIEAKQRERERVEEESRKTAEHRAKIDTLVAAAKWSKSNIGLADQDGKIFKQVLGKACGPVGVHKSESGRYWNVTHIPTGMAMAYFDSQSEAKVAAVRFAQFDLTRTAKELGSDKALGDLARAMRRTSDAYAQVI